MKKPKLLVIVPLLILSILPVLPGAIPKANAVTGVVCLTDNNTTGCPTSAQVLFAALGTQLLVRVQIAGSDNLNGFDIQIHTDPTVLKAADASLTGSIIGADANVVLKCLDGILVTGPACSTTDVNGVLHFAAVKLGALVAGNGLLFTAVYNVISKTVGISLNLPTVTISNGTGTPDSETTLGASFSNLSDFSVAASPSSITTSPGVVGTSTIALTSFGGFSDFITITVSPSAGLTASTADAGLFLAPNGIATTTLSASSGVAGSYSVDVTGTGSNPAFTHKVTVPVTVTFPGFSLAASPSSLSIAPGSSGTSTITVGSILGFTGTVMLSASSAILAAALNPSSVMLGATATSTLTVTAPAGTAPGPYSVTVTGTSGTTTRSITIPVQVGASDFSLNAVPDTVTIFRISPFTTATSSLDLASVNNFAGDVSLTATITFAFVSTPGSSSLPFTINPTVTLTAGGTGSSALIATVTHSTAGTGLYVATVTAVGGGKTHTATLSIWVIDFSVTPRDTTITIINQPGTLAQDPLSIGALGAPFNATGFNINPGLTEGTAAFPTVYYSSSRAGLKFAGSLGLDTSFTSRRCILATFDSSGNLIKPVKSATGTVISFAGPLVHLNGDQFGFPPNFNGCRLDSFFYVDPLNGNTLGATTDTDLVTVEPITTTPNGTFTTLVCLQAGGLINCVTITINMVAPPPSPPAFNQFLWQGHKLSLSKGTTLTLKAGLNTTITDPVLDAFVQVTAVSSDGNFVVVGTSNLVTLQPGTNTNNIVITLDFSGTPPGETYSISAIAFYGIHGVTIGSPSGTVYATGQSTDTIGTSGKIIGSLTTTS